VEKWRENKKKYTAEYKSKMYKRVPLDLRLSVYDAIKDHAASRNETVNGFIKRAISETMQRDKETPSD